MTWSILEMARSLRTCPWGLLVRAPLPLPRPEPLAGDLDGLRDPWAADALAAVGDLPDSRREAGATWLPLHGSVAWTAESTAFAHDDALTCWMRTRLTDAFHAARVALLSGDESAARMSVGMVAAFRARHPLGKLPAWEGAMEAGLRGVRLVHVAALLREARRVHGFDIALDEVALALAEHESFLRARCDWRLHFTGNHHLVALAGAFLLAAHLPPSPARTRRARRLSELFWREACREIGPDGVHFESSTGYHLLAAETAGHVALVGARLGYAMSPAARARLAACAATLAALTRPDGTLAAIGDCDDGAFLDLSPSSAPPTPLDARQALALLALATDDGLAAARSLGCRPALEAATWLVGADAGARLARLAAPLTHAPARPAVFPDGGLGVLACGGDDGAHVTVSCTSSGRAGTGGHGHDDAGAYEFWLGRPLIVDRGTGAYARDPALRRLLRGVASHSVMQVDGREMNAAAPGLFRREEWAKPLMTGYSSSAGGAIGIGHHGFCRAPNAVTVMRSLALSKQGELEVIDELVGGGEHDVVLHLPLAPGLHAILTGDLGRAQIAVGERILADVEFETPASHAGLVRPRIRVVPAVHAPRQLERLAAETIEVTWRVALPARFCHRVRPRSA